MMTYEEKVRWLRRYEITYDGDKHRFYLDAYKKFENRCISA